MMWQTPMTIEDHRALGKQLRRLRAELFETAHLLAVASPGTAPEVRAARNAIRHLDKTRDALETRACREHPGESNSVLFALYAQATADRVAEDGEDR